MDEISLKAPAKVNLYLKVLGKRPDGFHEIESLMQAVDLYDIITLEKSDVVELTCDDPNIPNGDSNLAVKAALAFRDRFYFPGVKIDLKKNIPHGAGLGGGSSDAAFVLRGLCKLFKIVPDPKEILEIAAAIGSDVPFFLGRGQALVRGRGENVETIRMPTDYEIILLVPPMAISTADIYRKVRINLTKKSESILLKTRITISRFNNLVTQLSNDLEEAVTCDYPELIELKEILRGAGAIAALMTGSGSAFFGIFPSGKSDKSVIERRVARGTRIFVCEPVVLPSLYMGR